MKASIAGAWAVSSLLALGLSACGGGGGAEGSAGGAAAFTAGPGQSPGPSATSSPVASSVPASASPSTSDPSSGAPPASNGEAPPTTAPAQPPGRTVIRGTDGPDTLQGSGEPVVMAGGPGDDTYIVTHPDDEVVERPGEGTDEIRTHTGYTLPPDVENLSVHSSDLAGGSNALVGNSLANRITGAAFTKADISGMDGDDVLDGGGRYGGNLDGGNGNDTLVNNIGESRGGPGADTFVVGPRGAHTGPDVPMTVLDFNPQEGDRIHAGFLRGGDPAALFSTGHLRFDAANQRLVYTLDPARFETTPSAVEQIILLPGLAEFQPSWFVLP